MGREVGTSVVLSTMCGYLAICMSCAREQPQESGAGCACKKLVDDSYMS